MLSFELLELHVVHHCNLTCSGCSHFSPTAPKWFADAKQFEEEIQLASLRLAPVFVHILGGEPLLHPTLHEFVTITRKAFKQSTIKLVTNGILFPRATAELLLAMVENNINLAVSIYPKVKTNPKKIAEICLAHKIPYEFWRQDTFLDFIDPLGSNNPVESRAHCPMIGAYTIRNNRLYPCPVTAWADFGGAQICEADGIDLHGSLSELASVADLKRTTSRCRFCRTEPKRVLHQLSR